MDTNNLTTILLIDANINTATKLSIGLSDIGYKTYIASNEYKVYEELSLINPQIIILNALDKSLSAKQLLISIQEKFITTTTSIIVISDDTNIEDKLFYLKSGAKDYIQSPFAFKELTARIEIQLKIFKNYEMLKKENLILKEQYEICKKLAITDELTGLYNKRYLIDRLKTELNYSNRYNRPLSLLMVDIDHFKKINDTYGHLTGDKVLKETATTICNYLRETDILIRYGGEEFVAIIPNMSLSGSKTLAEKIRKKVSQSIIKIDQIKIKLTISIGLSQYMNNKSDSPDEAINRLIYQADLALYSAKSTGRNKTIIYPFKLLNQQNMLKNNLSLLKTESLSKNDYDSVNNLLNFK